MRRSRLPFCLPVVAVAIAISSGNGSAAWAADGFVSTEQPSAAHAVADRYGNMRITYGGESGSLNMLVQTQSGESNLAQQFAYGQGGMLTVIQAAQGNTALQLQYGRNDAATIVQSGTANVARQSQR